MGKGDAMEQTRTVSKGTFESVVFVLILTFSIAEMILGLTIGRAFRRQLDGAMIGGLFFLNLVLARIAADRIFRRLGMSRSGKTLEIRGRTAAFPEGEVADDEVVEVHCPRSLVRGLSVLCMVVCLVMASVLALIQLPPWETAGCWIVLVFLGAFGSSAWWGW